ncbi:hypothetical protein EKO04_009141 [Ascochyta lentis]|uniref:Uncharacterized protein n=1 Tax=Ascochyta lentis TaxID=205686 RepID=A0A8H7IW66_9PLEO|nr:hypothetical protein EKO04_009141 [Ascochyta lentis]
MGIQSSRPWTPKESTELLCKVFEERDKRRLRSRSRGECEEHLMDFYKFLGPYMPTAIDAYNEKTPQSSISKEESFKIIGDPGREDEEYYYDLLSEVFMLGERTLRGGISYKVKEFYAVGVVDQPRLDQENDTEFYLSP